MTQRSQTGRKVFVTNLGHHDYTKVDRFGDLVPLTTRRVDIYHTDRMMSNILPLLDTMHPEDYILVSGNPAIVALVIAEVMERFKKVNILYWDPLYSDYILRT